jgi:hypothetical protein
MNIKLRTLESKILYFNGLYKLPIAPYPSIMAVAAKEQPSVRIENFLSTLRDELKEGEDIIAKLKNGTIEEIDFLVEMADWLGDIQVYCRSEMAKFGIPGDEVLNIIMQSNFSKLDANGQPIYNEEGKVMKGPMYWKPEPQIKQLLLEKITEAVEAPKHYDNKMVWREDK